MNLKYCEWCGEARLAVGNEELKRVTFTRDRVFHVCEECYNMWNDIGFRTEELENLIIRISERL